jgi:AraC-like DNA-binding protein
VTSDPVNLLLRQLVGAAVRKKSSLASLVRSTIANLMALAYHEWRPRDALRETILTFWGVEGDGVSVPSPTILPDAYVEIVINLGEPVVLWGPSFKGQQPVRLVVGLLERAIQMRYGGRVLTLGIRLHPARAAGFLGVRAVHLANKVTPLGELSPRLDACLAEWLGGSPEPHSPRDRAGLEDLLEEQQRQSTPSADRLVVRAVDRLLGALQPLTVVRLARELGVTPRHLHGRFMATVGTPPKRLERLSRFARTWQQATMGPSLGWAELAYANGYADQAHLVREFRAFGATPPAHLFSPEWYEVTTVERTNPSGHEEVRPVHSRGQDSDASSTHRRERRAVKSKNV